MSSGANIVVYAGLLIGLGYGAVGLLSGFCLMSSLRGWWAEGDSRLIRSFPEMVAASRSASARTFAEPAHVDSTELHAADRTDRPAGAAVPAA